MSQGTTIDYDALAQQHGGTAAVDYDTLAAQHGGTAQTGQAQERPGFIRRGLQAVGVPTSYDELKSYVASRPADVLSGGVLPLAKNLATYAMQLPQAVKEYAATPKADPDDVRRRMESGKITKDQAVEELAATAKAHAKLIPLLGNTLETAANDLAQHNPGGAAGGLIGVGAQLAAPEILRGAGPAISRVASPIADTLASGVGDAFNSAAKSAKPAIAKGAQAIADVGGEGVLKDVIGLASPRLAHLQRVAESIGGKLAPDAFPATHEVLNTIKQAAGSPPPPNPFGYGQTSSTLNANSYIEAVKARIPKGAPDVIVQKRAAQMQAQDEGLAASVKSAVDQALAKTPDAASSMEGLYGKTATKSNLKANQRQLASPTASTAPGQAAAAAKELPANVRDIIAKPAKDWTDAETAIFQNYFRSGIEMKPAAPGLAGFKQY